MVEPYGDLRGAYARAEWLNKIEGRRAYVVTGAADGWAVRRVLPTPQKPPAPELIRLKNWVRQLAYGSPNARVP